MSKAMQGLFVVMAMGLGVPCLAGPLPLGSAAPRKLDAVLWVGGFAHEFDEMARILSEELPKRIPVGIRVVKDGAFLDDPEASRPDVLLMNHCFESTDKVLTESQQAKLLGLIRGGMGVVGIHASYYSFVKWDAMRGLWGATFTQHGSSDARVVVSMVDRKHPITRHLAPSFEVTTELYQSTELAKDCHLLARAKEQGTDREWPSVWTKAFGTGRVVVILPAHFPAAYHSEEFLKLIASSAMWAAKRPVPAPVEREGQPDSTRNGEPR